MRKYKYRLIKFYSYTMRILLFVSLALLLLQMTGCRDEFMPDLNKYEELLVVDALISDQPGPYTVKLSLTSEVNTPTLRPFSGCEVRLEENTGLIETFTETAPGVYQSTADGMQTESGKSYKLFIKTPDGKIYSSDFIEMKPVVEIQNVHAELQFKESLDYVDPIAGYQFFISSQLSDEEVNLLWRLEETYEYTSEFSIDYIYRGMGIEEFSNTDTLYRCWRSQNVNDFFIESTQALSSNQVSDKPLHYVNTETKKLQVRYSLLARQYNISDEAYTYWKSIKEQVASDDFIFTSQPYQIIGNVKSEENPDERVLGYFTVASVSEKRFFFDRPENIIFHYPKCVPNTDLRGLGFLGPDQFPVYLANTPQGIALASEFCFDCTLWGGELARPEFWEDAKSEKNNHKNP